MSPIFERDWSRLREQKDRVNLHLRGEQESNWENVLVTDVDDEGRFIKVWSEQGGHPRGTLLREIYDVELL